MARRTVYLHFPSLDHLMLDAIAGSMGTAVDDAVAAMSSCDARVRLDALVTALSASMFETLPLGRRLIKLTVDRAGAGEEPLRVIGGSAGSRQRWSRCAPNSGLSGFARLVSALAMVVGWEAFVVLADVRGLGIEASGAIVRDAALVVLDAACR